jgi:hypothetical protein
MMFFVLHDGQRQSGPHSRDELRLLIKDQVVKPSDLIWSEGWDLWKIVSEAPGIITPPPTAVAKESVLRRSEKPRADTGAKLTSAATLLDRPEVVAIRENTEAWMTGAPPQSQNAFQSQLDGKTKVSKTTVIYWIAFGLMLPGLILSNPLLFLGCLCFGTLACFDWAKRRTCALIIQRGMPQNFFIQIYLPALWSYCWRSFLAFLLIAIAVASLYSKSSEETGRIVGALLCMWFLVSLFVPVVPWWVRRRLKADGSLCDGSLPTPSYEPRGR